MTTNINAEDVAYAQATLAKIAKLKDQPKSMKGFEWPEFNTEGERIKAMTEKYKEDSIQESFAKEYKIRFSKSFLRDVSTSFGETEMDPQPGDNIMLRIKDITKKGVAFYQGNIKETIKCNTNLYQYPRLRDCFAEMKPISCKVISRNINEIVVDPLAGMLDDWIASTTLDLQSQYHMTEDRSITVESLHLVRGGFTGRIRVDTISNFCGKDMYMEAFIPGSQIVLNVEYDFEKWEGQSVQAFVTNYTNKPGNSNMTLICSVKELLRHEGNKQIIEWFKMYCDDSKEWDEVSNQVFDGVITGVCHTQNKCGAFVELPDQHITAMIPLKPEQLCHYKRGADIRVMIDHFDEPTKWNGLQLIHLVPYIINDDILENMSLRIVLKEAE